jgi:hypothetical protein
MNHYNLRSTEGRIINVHFFLLLSKVVNFKKNHTYSLFCYFTSNHYSIKLNIGIK